MEFGNQSDINEEIQVQVIKPQQGFHVQNKLYQIPQQIYVPNDHNSIRNSSLNSQDMEIDDPKNIHDLENQFQGRNNRYNDDYDDYDDDIENQEGYSDNLTQGSLKLAVRPQIKKEDLYSFYNAKPRQDRLIPSHKTLMDAYVPQGPYIKFENQLVNPYVQKYKKPHQLQQIKFQPQISQKVLNNSIKVINNTEFKKKLPDIQQSQQDKFKAHSHPLQLQSLQIRPKSERWRAQKNFKSLTNRGQENIEDRQAYITYNYYDEQIRNAYEAYVVAKNTFSQSAVGSVTIAKTTFDALTIQELGMTSTKKWPMHGAHGINSPFYKDLILGQPENLTDVSILQENFLIVNPLAVVNYDLGEKTTLTHFPQGLPCLENDVQILSSLEQDLLLNQALQLGGNSRVNNFLDQIVIQAIYVRDFLLSHLFRTVQDPIVEFYAYLDFMLDTQNNLEQCGENIKYYIQQLKEEYRKVKLYREGDEENPPHPLHKINQFFHLLAEFRQQAAQEKLCDRIKYSCFQYCTIKCKSGQGKSYAGFNSIQDNIPVSFATREPFKSKCSVVNTKDSQADAIPYFIFQCQTRKNTVVQVGIQYQWYKDFPYEFEGGFLVRHFSSEFDMNQHCLHKRELKKCHKAMITAAQQAKYHLGNAAFSKLKNIIPGYDWNFILGDKSN